MAKRSTKDPDGGTKGQRQWQTTRVKLKNGLEEQKIGTMGEKAAMVSYNEVRPLGAAHSPTNGRNRMIS